MDSERLRRSMRHSGSNYETYNYKSPHTGNVILRQTKETPLFCN